MAVWSRLAVLKWISVFAICAALALAAYVAILAPAEEAARYSDCGRHLAMVGQAMRGYHDAYGCFPPAVVRDSRGKAAHINSWRVLILPFLGEQDLYDKYTFAEPWNGPHNSKLAKSLVGRGGIYRCPFEPPGAPIGETNYVVVTGQGALFDDAKCVTQADVTDEPSTTLMVAEAANTGIHWMEPRDLKLESMNFSVGAPRGNNLSSKHPRGPHVLTVLGTTPSLSTAANESDIRAITSIAGGDPQYWPGESVSARN